MLRAIMGMLVTVSNALVAELAIHNAPDTIPVSEKYSLTINGEACRVQEVYADFMAVDRDDATFQKYGMANFSFSDPVELKIRVSDEAVKSAVVRPLSRGITPEISGNEITLTLPEPMYVVLEVNNDPSSELHIFGNPVEQDVPNVSGEDVIKIQPRTDYGADEITDIIKNKPGALVYFAPGLYAGKEKALRIIPAEGQTLYFAGGAYMNGCTFRINADNVTLRGRGVIDKNADKSYSAKGQMLLMDNAKNLNLEGLTFLDAWGWCVAMHYSDGVHIRNFKIIAHRQNSDGINPLSSKNVLIEKSFIHNGDDGIAIKALNGISTEDITVRDMVIWIDFGWAACEIGKETNGEYIRDVLFENIDVLHAYGSAIGIGVEGSAIVTNITYRNIRSECPREKTQMAQPGYMIEFQTRVKMRPPIPPGGHPPPTGWIDGVLIENLQLIEESPDQKTACQLISYSDKNPIRNIKIKDMKWMGKPVTDFKTGNFYISGAVSDVSFQTGE
ncbi:MAG: glycosyl hydrolase family 28 protein [Kiritimatiellales bacterium]